MRQPIVARPRRRTRQQRLARTFFLLVVLIALIALVGKFAGKSKQAIPTPKVSFVANTAAEGDTRTPDPAAVKTESAHIVAMLNDWYQQAFVDPKLYGDGKFKGVKAHFSRDAQASFDSDVASLTIGDARMDVKRVVPGTALADVTVFFRGGRTPTYAVAAVTFEARATLKAKDSLPLSIKQTMTLHLERRPNGDWTVTYYKAHESQDSIQPSPSGSPS